MSEPEAEPEAEIYFPLPPDTLVLSADLVRGVLYRLTIDALSTRAALAVPPWSAYTQGESAALRRSMAHVLSCAYGVQEDTALGWVGDALEDADLQDDREAEAVRIVAGLLRRR